MQDNRQSNQEECDASAQRECCAEGMVGQKQLKWYYQSCSLLIGFVMVGPL